jgi:hypothetical protein
MISFSRSITLDNQMLHTKAEEYQENRSGKFRIRSEYDSSIVLGRHT